MKILFFAFLFSSFASASSTLVLPPPPPPAGPVADHELLLDPKFAAGLSVFAPCKDRRSNPECAIPAVHEARNAYQSRNDGFEPAWTLTQWESNSPLSPDSNSVDGGIGFVTPAKRVLFFRDGRIQLSVNGAVEFDGSYREEAPKSLLLEQSISSDGKYQRPSGSVGEMNNLVFSLDMRRLSEKQNKQSGFNADRHGVRFPIQFTLRNLRTASQAKKDAAKEVILELVPYSDREEKPFRASGGSSEDGSYVYSVPYRDAASSSLHDDKWVHFEVDLLPHAKKAIEAASAQGLAASADPADYQVGGVRLGYELSGLNASSMELKNISLKVSAASLLASAPADADEGEAAASKEEAVATTTSGASRAPGPSASSTKTVKSASDGKATAAATSRPSASGFYRADGSKTIYSADGNGNFCALRNWDSFLLAGGRADSRNVQEGKPSGKYTGHCIVNKDAQTILDRLRAKYLAEPGKGRADGWLKGQQDDGSWKDVNYAATAEPWDPGTHLKRLRTMAIAYRTPSSPEFGSRAILEGISRGLSFWYKRKPTSENWWHNDIGQQLELAPILVLMHGDLPDDLLKTGIAYMIAPEEAGGKKFPTGENLIWYAGEQLVRGALLDNVKDITTASNYIQKVFNIREALSRPMSPEKPQWTTGEGLQTDYSFHQHGPLIYNGGYGLGALSSAADYGSVLKGTEFEFIDQVWKTMVDNLLSGTGMFVRGSMMDLGIRGRNISRAGTVGAAKGVASAAEDLVKAGAPRAGELTALAKHIQGEGKQYSFIGNKHFWNSDYTVHQREGYYASVKMFSSRTKGTESLKGENHKGYWLPFGMNLIARDGNEYPRIPPHWNYMHLPGVTSPEWLPKIGSSTQPESFVGGVSDKQYGAAGMKLQAPKAEGSSLRAQKAWFFFDDEFVALGTGISADDDAVVNTTLNQTTLRGEILADGAQVGAGTKKLKKQSWVLHDRVGYVFPNDADVNIQSEKRQGSWKDINPLQSPTVFEESIFTLWVSHGKKPRDASYSYVVVPDTDAAQLAKYAKKPPVQILANSEKIQAVKHHGLNLTQAVFYSPGTLKMGGGFTVSVNEPSFVMVMPKEGDKDVYMVTVASPVSPEVEVTLKSKTGSAKVNYKLSTGPRTGSSYAKPLRLVAGEEPDEVKPTYRPKGFFRIRGTKTVYLSDGNGSYCRFQTKESYVKAGGRPDFSDVENLKERPQEKLTGFCSP